MEPLDLVAGLTKVSDQIRLLSAAGYTIAQIEKILGKRYQHVRGVVRTATPEQMRQAHDRLRQIRGQSVSQGVEEESTAWIGPPMGLDRAAVRAPHQGIYQLVVQADGGFILPPALLAALHLKPGAVVAARIENGALILLSREENLRRLQERVARYLPADAPSLADDLIADRRREAEMEASRG